jgi:hypothetical protein
MYPASRWSVAPGHHGYQRACDLVMLLKPHIGAVPHRWTVVLGNTSVQRFGTKAEAEDALDKAEEQGRTGYILPPLKALN